MAEERPGREGISNPRSVLGDITNKFRKRAVGKSFHFDENSIGVLGKRACITPRLCMEGDMPKGNDASRISKIPNQGKGCYVLGLSSVFGASKRVGGDCDDSGRLDDTDCSEGEDLPRIDGSVNQNHKEFCLKACEREEFVNSFATEPDLLKENVLALNKSPCLERAVGADTVNPEIHAGENVVGSSRISDKQNDSNVYELGSDDLRSVSEKDDDCSLRDSANRDEDLSLGGTLGDLKNSQKDVNDVDKFALSQLGFIDCPILPESQESNKVVELGTQLGNDCVLLSGETHSLKDCSCSFCTKAGYIWLDLNYQDIKARVTALRKSQKEASILAERSSRGKAIEKHISVNSNRASQLESQLMYQWRSLFQHMSNLWEQESNQLEASLLPLSDLKEKCKTQMVYNDDVRSVKR